MKKLILLLAITLFGGVIIATYFLKSYERQKTCAAEAHTYFSENKWEMLYKESSFKLDAHFNDRLQLCLLRVDESSSHSNHIFVNNVRDSDKRASVILIYAKMNLIAVKYLPPQYFVLCRLSNGNKCSNEKEAIADADRLMSE